jgi:antitoxin StbD
LGGKPVAILKNSQLVGYLVPEEATDKGQRRYARREKAMEALRRTKKRAQSVLDYLRDN